MPFLNYNHYNNLFISFAFIPLSRQRKKKKQKLIQRQEEKIQEMIAIMQKAADLDDLYFEQNLKQDRENMSRLIVENEGLRELLQISKKFGTLNVATDIDKVCVQTQTDSDAEAINSNNNSNVDGAKKANTIKKTASDISTTSAPPTKISNINSSAAANSKKNSATSNPSSATTPKSTASTTNTTTAPTPTSTAITSPASKVSSPSSTTSTTSTSSSSSSSSKTTAS